jgi:hypothetical protein
MEELIKGALNIKTFIEISSNAVDTGPKPKQCR